MRRPEVRPVVCRCRAAHVCWRICPERVWGIGHALARSSLVVSGNGGALGLLMQCEESLGPHGTRASWGSDTWRGPTTRRMGCSRRVAKEANLPGDGRLQTIHSVAFRRPSSSSDPPAAHFMRFSVACALVVEGRGVQLVLESSCNQKGAASSHASPSSARRFPAKVPKGRASGPRANPFDRLPKVPSSCPKSSHWILVGCGWRSSPM